jgi:beta-xylosidase
VQNAILPFLGLPFLDREPLFADRDPAVIFHDGVFRCFHTTVESDEQGYSLFVEMTASRDLTQWTPPCRLTPPGLNFSSPGSILRVEDHWVLCLQSYPIPPGGQYGTDDSRLWLMESRDLEQWSSPRLLQPEGCRADWARSRRQIDPYLICHERRYWCFYKTDGSLGLLVSDDLVQWQEASPERPVLSAADTPDGATVENPCVLQVEGHFVLFFAPCRAGRGIGVARSEDLRHWYDVRYLDFPAVPWAPGGPTAAMVLDMRQERGHWEMFFHGDRLPPHGAALGRAWSEDLEQWHLA